MTNFTNGNETVNELSQEASSLVAQYKNIIREQDHKIQTLNEKLKQLHLQNENIMVNCIFNNYCLFFNSFLIFHTNQTKLTETQASMSKISDQNILLRAQLTATSTGQHQNGFPDQSTRVAELENQIMSLMNEKLHHDTRISFYEAENARLLTEIEQFKKISGDLDEVRNEKIEKTGKEQDDVEDLLELLADQDNKLMEYKKRLTALGQPVSDDEEES